MNQIFVFLVKIWKVLLCFLLVCLPMMCLLILLLLEPGFLVLSTFLSSDLQNFGFYLLLLLLTHPLTPSKRYLPTATSPLPCNTTPTPTLNPVSTVVYIGISYTYSFYPLSCLCYLQPVHTQSIYGMFLMPSCDCRGTVHPMDAWEINVGNVGFSLIVLL